MLTVRGSKWKRTTRQCRRTPGVAIASSGTVGGEKGDVGPPLHVLGAQVDPSQIDSTLSATT
jgi:hypothetical protein